MAIRHWNLQWKPDLHRQGHKMLEEIRIIYFTNVHLIQEAIASQCRVLFKEYVSTSRKGKVKNTCYGDM